jgi:hypothetical protein
MTSAKMIGTVPLACCSACAFRSGRGQDHIWRKPNQFHCIFANAVGIKIAGAPTIVDLQIAADGPTQLLEPCRKAAFRLLASYAAKYMSTPMRRPGSPCCARAAIRHAAAPLRSVMNSRRFIQLPHRR